MNENQTGLTPLEAEKPRKYGGAPTKQGLELFTKLALTEDHGGSNVIRRHEEDLLLFECPARELEDADTRQALRAMEERKRLI